MQMNHFPIYAGSLQPQTSVLFDAFVLVGGKHLPCFRKAETVDLERLKKLHASNTTKLFIPVQEEPAYFEYLRHRLESLKAAKSPLQFLLGTLSTLTENLPRTLEEESSFRATSSLVSLASEYLRSHPNALKAEISELKGSNDIIEHSAKVAILSLALAPRLGLQDDQELCDMGVAALLHDLGKLSMNLPFGVSLDDLPRSITQAYLSHPSLSVELISEKRYINVRIRRLIGDHEEMGQGEGFPAKKNVSELSLSSQVLNLCNDFERYATINNTSLLKAFKPYTKDKRGVFDSLHLLRLGEMLSGK